MRRVGIAVLLALIAVTVLIYLSPRLLTAGPAQPVAFSHQTHAGEREIACAYCHEGVAKSSVAGVPPIERCVGCHPVVAPNDSRVQQLMAYWNNRQPIPWVRVYRVPDFVYFSHQMHIAADVACASCHGNVAAMDRIARAQPLTMGWCLGCHYQRGASTDCWTCHE